MSETDLPDDSERTTAVAEPVHTEPTTEHHEPPRGTMVIVGLFLLLMIFMFGWAYLILIVRG